MLITIFFPYVRDIYDTNMSYLGACTCGGHLAPAGAPEKGNDNEIDFTSKK